MKSTAWRARIMQGAEDYLTKPLNPILLKARINASLEKKRLRDRQKELIRKFAASEVADDLAEKGFSLGGQTIQVSILFSDIRSFTAITASLPASDIIELLNNYYSLMFEAINGHGGMVNQMLGDGIMALFGAPAPLQNTAEPAVLAALEMIEFIDMFNQQQAALDRVPDPHRDWHCNRNGGRRVYGNDASCYIYMRRRHGQPGLSPGSLYQNRQAADLNR